LRGAIGGLQAGIRQRPGTGHEAIERCQSIQQHTVAVAAAVSNVVCGELTVLARIWTVLGHH
jgi:hypothetical protein